MAHVWIIEMRIGAVGKCGPWRLLEFPRHEFAFSRRAEATDACRELNARTSLWTRYRVRRYERREG
jgi:hypothetical protein